MSATGPVARATLLANAVTYLMLGVGVAFLVPEDPTLHRARMTEVINAATVARMEASEHFQAHGRFRAGRIDNPTRYTRRVVTEESGRVVAEINNPGHELDGKTVVYEPVLKDGRIEDWRCRVPEAPLKYFPAACRFRDAGQAR
jgi:hypothetical protein